MTMAPKPSTTECCFNTTVETQIETARIKDSRTTHSRSLKQELLAMAMWTPMELNTWTLGKILVEVSALWRRATIQVNTFLSGSTTGLRSVPLW